MSDQDKTYGHPEFIKVGVVTKGEAEVCAFIFRLLRSTLKKEWSVVDISTDQVVAGVYLMSFKLYHHATFKDKTFESLLNHACTKLRITKEDFFNRHTKQHRVVAARDIISYVLYTGFDIVETEVARMIKSSCHACVSLSLKKFTNRLRLPNDPLKAYFRAEQRYKFKNRLM